MANVLNLRGEDDPSLELAQQNEEAVRLNRARILSQKLETEIAPKTSDEKRAAQLEAVRQARERNAKKGVDWKSIPTADDQSQKGDPRQSLVMPKQEDNKVSKAGKAMQKVGGALEATGVGAEFGAGLQTAGKITQAVSGLAEGFQRTLEKMGYGTVFLMTGTALFLDVLKLIIGIIPIVGEIIPPLIGLLASGIFLLWFKIKGFQWNKTRVIIFLIGTVVDITPILDLLTILPCTITLILTLMNDSAEALVGPLPKVIDVTDYSKYEHLRPSGPQKS